MSADVDRRAVLVALAGAGRDGITLGELARATGLTMKRIHWLLRQPRANSEVVPQPEGRQRRVHGRWRTLWVRADLLLDEGPIVAHGVTEARR